MLKRKKIPYNKGEKDTMGLLCDYIMTLELEHQLSELLTYYFSNNHKDNILNEIDVAIWHGTGNEKHCDKNEDEKMERFFVKVVRASEFIREQKKGILEEIKTNDKDLYKKIIKENKEKKKKYHLYFDVDVMEYYPLPSYLVGDNINENRVKEFGEFYDYAAAIYSSFVKFRVIK